MRFGILLLGLSSLIGQAQACDFAMCSKNFYGSLACNGADQLPINQGPWENVAIKIVGVEVVIFQPPPNVNYVFSGNSVTPDIMLLGGPGTTTMRSFYPSPLGFYFPPIGTAGLPHIDLHIACGPVGSPVQLFYNVYYTNN